VYVAYDVLYRLLQHFGVYRLLLCLLLSPCAMMRQASISS
jgi:hypothetical protein